MAKVMVGLRLTDERTGARGKEDEHGGVRFDSSRRRRGPEGNGSAATHIESLPTTGPATADRYLFFELFSAFEPFADLPRFSAFTLFSDFALFSSRWSCGTVTVALHVAALPAWSRPSYTNV